MTSPAQPAQPEPRAPDRSVVWGRFVPLAAERDETRLPYATAVIAVGFLVSALVSSLPLVHAHGQAISVAQAAAYVVGKSSPDRILLAVLVGPTYLFGTTIILLAFGDAVEQRLGAWPMVGLFFVGGIWAIVVDALLMPKGSAIASPVGGVLALLGAVIVLAPRTRMRLPYSSFWQHRFLNVPIWVIVLVVVVPWVLLSVPAHAIPWGMLDWRAKLAAFVLGVAVGAAWRLRAQAPDPPHAVP